MNSEQQKETGQWILPNTRVGLVTFSKPRWLTRYLMRLLLEWRWEEDKPPSKGISDGK
jgi:hypothetical protein